MDTVFDTGMGSVVDLDLGVDGMQPMVLYLDDLRCLKVGDAGKWEVFEYGGRLVWAFAMSLGGGHVESGVAVTNRE